MKLKMANSSKQYFYYPWEHFLKSQELLGQQYIELYGTTPHIFIDHYSYENCQYIVDSIESRGLILAAFTLKPYNYSICNENTEHRGFALNYYKNCILAAKAMGLDFINMDLVDGAKDTPKEQLYENCISSLAELCCFAEEQQMQIALGIQQNTGSSLVSTLSEMEQLLHDINRDNMKVQINTSALAAAHEEIDQWLQALGSNVRYIHLSDCIDGKFCILGQGTANVARTIEVLKQLNYTNGLGLELLDDNLWQQPIIWDYHNITQYRSMVGR